jgi:hypothetical protein
MYPGSCQADPSHNISFSVDGVQSAGATTSPTIPKSNVMVFAQRGLTDGPHSLAVTIGENADFAFDYLKYTQYRRRSGPLIARQEPTVIADPSTSIATASASPSSSAQ